MGTVEKAGVLPGADAAATAALVLSTLFSLAVAYAYVLSLSEALDPPGWARVLGLLWLPVGLAGVPIGYYWSRGGAREGRAELAVVVALVAALAFVVLVVALG